MKIPTTLKNVFFYNPGSLFSNVGVLLLYEKRVQDKYQFIPVDTAHNENITPEFIRLNHYGKVPVLIHEGKVISDSLTIAQALDEQQDNNNNNYSNNNNNNNNSNSNSIPSLKSTEENIINKVNSWRQVRILSLWKGKKTPTMNHDIMEQQLSKSRQQLLTYQQENPDLYEAYQIRLKTHDDRAKVLLDHDTYLKYVNNWHHLLDTSNQYLKYQSYLAGNQFTLVDIYAISFLFWSQQKLEQPHLVFESRPYLKKYYDLQLNRTSVKNAFL